MVPGLLGLGTLSLFERSRLRPEKCYERRICQVISPRGAESDA